MSQLLFHGRKGVFKSWLLYFRHLYCVEFLFGVNGTLVGPKSNFYWHRQ